MFTLASRSASIDGHHTSFLARFFKRETPGCVWCNSSISTERWIVGTMTLVPHRIHPSSQDSWCRRLKNGINSSDAFFSGQRCNTYCSTRNKTGSVFVASLIVVTVTGPSSRCWNRFGPGSDRGTSTVSGRGSLFSASAFVMLVPGR